MMTEAFDHDPVMRDEITELFATVPSGTIVDATLGGGGHSAALLDSRADIDILGIDQDADALHAATEALAPYGDRVRTSRRRFDELDAALDEHHIDAISGALFDLGVSSPQLDRGDRGFSYRHDGPLDMRMDADQTWSAADVVNGYSERDLARVIRRYGDERFADRIARAICAARPIQTTTELAAVVTTAIPAAARRTGGHPAKRTFQAIRIEVNDELGVLPDALDAAVEATRPGGRIAVLSYHSGEDRIVKERFASASGACDCPDDLPCVCGAIQTVRIVRGIPKKPSAAERAANRRAASARLRVVERIIATRKSDGMPVADRHGHRRRHGHRQRARRRRVMAALPLLRDVEPIGKRRVSARRQGRVVGSPRTRRGPTAAGAGPHFSPSWHGRWCSWVCSALRCSTPSWPGASCTSIDWSARLRPSANASTNFATNVPSCAHRFDWRTPPARWGCSAETPPSSST